MSTNLDLTNSAVDRVRLRLGDFHCPYILADLAEIDRVLKGEK